MFIIEGDTPFYLNLIDNGLKGGRGVPAASRAMAF